MFVWFLGCATAIEPSPTDFMKPKSAPVVDEGYAFTTEPLSESRRAAMQPASWRPGCPVDLDDLVLAHVAYWDFSDHRKFGELIVHRDVVPVLERVFRVAYQEHYPIERMEPVSVFGGSDAKSMAANNTSAFNCRPVSGTHRFSEHATGKAIDINPLRNPYVSRSGRTVQPPEGRGYLDRTKPFQGRLVAGDAMVEAFRAQGWGWGGLWKNSKDYQHFSESGR